jgi:hypothetical protein
MKQAITWLVVAAVIGCAGSERTDRIEEGDVPSATPMDVDTVAPDTVMARDTARLGRAR